VRVLICGDREWTDPLPIHLVVRATVERSRTRGEDTTIIAGGARGADSIAARFTSGFADLEEYPADWAKYGKAAGPIRNQQMLDEGKPDIVFAFHDDLAISKGTGDMVRRAKAAGIPVYVVSRP
jgi:hypothetical protein